MTKPLTRDGLLAMMDRHITADGCEEGTFDLEGLADAILRASASTPDRGVPDGFELVSSRYVTAAEDPRGPYLERTIRLAARSPVATPAHTDLACMDCGARIADIECRDCGGRVVARASASTPEDQS